MKTISQILLKDLINSGVKTFFGVQGGACARLIESIIQNGGSYHPVLNEQAAGYYAHGHYLATRKIAGMVFTTGPGLVNGLSGLAACYYDRIPTVAIVGQVNKKINLATKTSTRMVGFQEVPHIELGRKISDRQFRISSTKSFKLERIKIIEAVKNEFTTLIEIPDDVQREISISANKIIIKKKNRKIKINKNQISSFLNKKKPIVILGSGSTHSNDTDKIIGYLNKNKIYTSVTWGAQNIQNKLKGNSLGIFGNHNPGFANKVIHKSTTLIVIGASLLQHQAGKNLKLFAPNAEIIFINNDIRECKRAKSQFGKRLKYFNCSGLEFINVLTNKKIKFIKNKITLDRKFKENLKDITPVNEMRKIFCKLSKDYVIFSDAGATLSWTYQAANLVKNCPPVYTSFNLHAMGYANCAGLGAAKGGKKNILVIIGDGSLPMNSQELAWCRNYKVQFLVVDNKGYGIIRQTQTDFYRSNYYGSDLKNSKSSLPYFSVKKIMNSFDIETNTTKNHFTKNSHIKWLLSGKKSRALIIEVDYKARVNTSNI